MSNYNITVFAGTSHVGKTTAIIRAAITAANGNPTKRVIVMIDNDGISVDSLEKLNDCISLQPTNLSIVLRNKSINGKDGHEDILRTAHFYDIVALDIVGLSEAFQFETVDEPDASFWGTTDRVVVPPWIQELMENIDYLYVSKQLYVEGTKNHTPLITFSTRIE